MAADYIRVDRTKQLGNRLVRCADQLLDVAQSLAELLAAGSHANDGSDYSVMETIFGLQTGTGANVLTLIDLIDTILNTGSTVAGTTRLAQIQEFTARLAGQ